ncbi:MAG: hypothetical protein JO106_17555 [Mycobacterium sp.]|nr:hypothetical protein [Mycobacterium sp.]
MFVDLSDLGLPAPLRTPDEVAAATAHVCERFTAFADDGWEWTVHPTAREFDGWVYQDTKEGPRLAGAQLRCTRLVPTSRVPAMQRAHGVNAYRAQQLMGQPYGAEPGTKIWRIIG